MLRECQLERTLGDGLVGSQVEGTAGGWPADEDVCDVAKDFCWRARPGSPCDAFIHHDHGVTALRGPVQ